MKILGENGIGKFLKVFLQICFWGGIVLLIALPLIAQIAKVHLNASIYVIYPNGIVLLVIVKQFIGQFDSLKNKNPFCIENSKRLKAVEIKTMPYPGFPTDMQSIFGALLITAKGTSVITENIFESRYKYAQELIRMGAKINVEGRTAIIKGTKKIQGTNVVATDLRGGAALIMAGLYAKGITQIDNIHYILRGYEKIDEKLKKLGAKIHVEK